MGDLNLADKTTKLWIKILFWAFVVIILFITLYPFYFEQFVRIKYLNVFFGGLNFGGYSRCCKHMAYIEPAANIVLFAPFGFFLYLINYMKWLNVRKIVGLTCLTGSLFSFLIEFLQVFQPERSPSMTDILMNSLGTGLGCLLAFRMRNYLVSKGSRMFK